MTHDELISMMQDVLAGPDADAPDYLVAYDDAVKLHAAIEAAGLCIVPVAATEAMQAAFWKPDELDAARSYRAMIEAGRI